jgi:hypothetical protein
MNLTPPIIPGNIYQVYDDSNCWLDVKVISGIEQHRVLPFGLSQSFLEYCIPTDCIKAEIIEVRPSLEVHPQVRKFWSEEKEKKQIYLIPVKRLCTFERQTS